MGDIGMDLYIAYEDGYKAGYAEAERKKKCKPTTNADRLRSMSAEEFATAICKHDGCPFRETEDDECLKHHYDCKACWIEWLKEEADNGQN